MKQIVFIFCLISTVIYSHAQKAGTPDTSFGRNGKQWDTTGHYVGVSAMVVQLDQKIIISKQTFLTGTNIRTFRIDRLLKNGNRDYTFGDGGKVVVDFRPLLHVNTYQATITALALQSDGKILACGYYSYSVANLLVVRFFSDGTIDSSFGKNGLAFPVVADTRLYSMGNAMLVQPDGKIVIGGSASVGFFLERLTTKGTLDSSFATGGQILEAFGAVYALAFQPDGKIIAAGNNSNGRSTSLGNFSIRCYLANGDKDTSFGNKGRVDTLIGDPYSALINDIALQPDGKIVIAGTTSVQPGFLRATLGRYNNNGMIDRSFGDSGIVITQLKNQHGDLVNAEMKKVMLWNGKIIGAGWKDAYEGTIQNISDAFLTAYNSDGKIDTAFVEKGVAYINCDPRDYLSSAALQADGKILLLVLGQDNNYTYQTRNVLRYYGYPAENYLLVKKNKLMLKSF